MSTRFEQAEGGLSTPEGIELERANAANAVRDNTFIGPDGERYPSEGSYIFEMGLRTCAPCPEIQAQWDRVALLPTYVDFAEE